jgi:hypothetical protein
MTTKKVSYKGVKADLPENVSMSAFKEIVEICNGFHSIVQPMVDLLSKKLYPLQKESKTWTNQM